MSPAQVLVIVSIVGGVLGIIALVAKGVSVVNKRLFRPLSQMWDGFFGDAGDVGNGIVPRPGVLARITRIELSYTELNSKVDQVVAEISPNHGNSTYDRVKRLDDQLTRENA